MTLDVDCVAFMCGTAVSKLQEKNLCPFPELSVEAVRRTSLLLPKSHMQGLDACEKSMLSVSYFFKCGQEVAEMLG